MTTRATLGGAVGLLVVAGTLGAGRPLDVRAVGGLNTVTVSPAHGTAAAPFQVSYVISPCQAAAGLTITFSWGALPAAGQILGTAATDSACRATLTTTPPVNTATHVSPAPGTYKVFGYVALPTGTPTPNTEASASYTVDINATPGPTARASATAKPSASASGNTAASASASAPTASDQPSVAPTLGAGNVALSKATGQPDSPTFAWQVVLAIAVMALPLLALIAILIAWILRRRRARPLVDQPNDKAA
jgi:hypothetical protein